MAKHKFYISGLEQDLLSLLKNNNGFYGLEILKLINEARLKHKVKILTRGSLYPTLERMENQGLIASVKSKQEKTPSRRYYTISSHGLSSLILVEEYRKRLSAWRSSDET
ncbi:PadR family transcriptional regulator [Nostoc sp.]|uniref:PadR family transcriptional regulator n=1 Tax=Nostoc sp. TaxID=1180 RepID=UPI002FF742E2